MWNTQHPVRLWKERFANPIGDMMFVGPGHYHRDTQEHVNRYTESLLQLTSQLSRPPLEGARTRTLGQAIPRWRSLPHTEGIRSKTSRGRASSALTAMGLPKRARDHELVSRYAYTRSRRRMPKKAWQPGDQALPPTPATLIPRGLDEGEKEDEEDEECAWAPGSPTGRQGSDLMAAKLARQQRVIFATEGGVVSLLEPRPVMKATFASDLDDDHDLPSPDTDYLGSPAPTH